MVVGRSLHYNDWMPFFDFQKRSKCSVCRDGLNCAVHASYTHASNVSQRGVKAGSGVTKVGEHARESFGHVVNDVNGGQLSHSANALKHESFAPSVSPE
jgi:hypothetical protein